MKVALQGRPHAFMPRPNGIVNVRINPETGERARPGEEGVFELFKAEQAPPLLSDDGNGNGGTGGGDLSRQLF
jgi:penicillin-binding protein 1A